MKIELTQKQYEALLKIVYLGSWMASSTKDEPEMEYEKIEQYILSFAKDFKMENFVGFDKKMKWTKYQMRSFWKKNIPSSRNTRRNFGNMVLTTST